MRRLHVREAVEDVGGLPELLSDVEVAKLIGVSLSYLRKSRSSGRLKNRTQAPPFTKINHNVFL
jgi:hypothetical protein